MNFYGRRFNLYLLPIAALMLASGCALFGIGGKQKAALRIHIQSDATAQDITKTISVMRSEPVAINIASEPILTELDLASAALIETPGGFAVQLKFDHDGSLALEEYSATNPGKHLVIFGQWDEKLAAGRWLAAPLITRRMAGGTLVFTPDASREESQKLVDGLNAVAEKLAGKKPKP
jgi:hypothetical protein